MRLNTMLLLVQIALIQGIFAQSDSLPYNPDKAYDNLDIQVEPEFPGGMQAMYHFLNQNVRYPEPALEEGAEGYVVVTFVVDKDGSITDVKIASDMGYGCGITVQRAFQRMPKWSPGMINGHPVKVRYTMPYCFWLMQDESKRPARPVPLPKRAMPNQLWTAVENAISLIYAVKTPLDQSFNLIASPEKRGPLVEMLESSFKIKTSPEDAAKLTTASDVADYFYKAQFAPIFFSEEGFKGTFYRHITSNAGFEASQDGFQKLNSISVPEGIKVTLYNQKDFLGKKLEIDASSGAAFVPNLSRVNFEKGRVSTDSKKYIDWAVATKSIKIELPEKFPGED
jgi:TonB family protein